MLERSVVLEEFGDISVVGDNDFEAEAVDDICMDVGLLGVRWNSLRKTPC